MEYSKEVIPMLNDIYATLLWKERNSIIDGDFNRMNNDFLDARRTIGCKLMDDIISECGKEDAACHQIPEHYFPYLCSISLMEFKKMKAYYLWTVKYGRSEISDDQKNKIYLEACDKIENSCINCSNKSAEKMPKHILNFLRDSKKSQFNNIIKRKSYWNGMYENCSDPYHNWKKAEAFAQAVYDPFESPGKLTRDDVIDIIDVINHNHHLTSLFEYCIRCRLMKQAGLSKKSPPPLKTTPGYTM